MQIEKFFDSEQCSKRCTEQWKFASTGKEQPVLSTLSTSLMKQ